MRAKLIITVFTFLQYFGISQISNAYIAGIYDVNITEWNCTPLTHYQNGLLFINLLNPNCDGAKDTSYTTNYWFYSSISFSITPADSSIHGYQYYNLASGRYFPHDSIHLYLYEYFGTQCSHEYFGKRKLLLSVEDLKLLNSFVSISPQPANEFFNISFPNGTIKKAPRLFDMSGKSMNLNFVKDEGNYKADAGELVSGIYFLSIETTAGILRKKIVVVH